LLKNSTVVSEARRSSYTCEHPLIRVASLTGTINRLAPFESGNDVAFQPFCMLYEDPTNYYDRHPHDLLSQGCSFHEATLDLSLKRSRGITIH